MIMPDLYYRIYAIYPNMPITFITNQQFTLSDHGDGNGPVITTWSNTTYPQPTLAQLEAVTSAQVTTAQAALTAKQTTTAALTNPLVQLYTQYVSSLPSGTLATSDGFVQYVQQLCTTATQSQQTLPPVSGSTS